jgi:hypothetical protein
MKIHLILAAIATCSITACATPTDQSATPGDSSMLSASEIPVIEQEALAGDPVATDKLIQFYTLASPNLSKIVRWQRIAAQRGDAGQMLNLATSLGIVGGPINCKEAETWLQQVIAKSSNGRLVRRATSNLDLLRSDGQCVQWLRPVAGGV